MPYNSSRPSETGAHASPHALKRLFATTLLALLLLPHAARAQQQGDDQNRRDRKPPEIVDDDEVLKIDTDLILVDVTVTDAEGKPLRGLRPEDFKLYEDGEERPVAFLNVERHTGAERPVAVVFAVDISGSMTP